MWRRISTTSTDPERAGQHAIHAGVRRQGGAERLQPVTEGGLHVPDHDGRENAASDAEPTKPSPARRRGYQPETSGWGGCGRHALYMVLRNTVPSVEPVTDRRLAAAERAARTSGRPGPRRDAEPR